MVKKFKVGPSYFQNTATRYPGENEPITEQEYKEAIYLAECIVNWIESKISEQDL